VGKGPTVPGFEGRPVVWNKSAAPHRVVPQKWKSRLEYVSILQKLIQGD
jgi:hypothetical protein